jgi:hypothetical protein
VNSTNHSSIEHEKDRTMPTKRMTDKKLIAAEGQHRVHLQTVAGKFSTWHYISSLFKSNHLHLLLNVGSVQMNEIQFQAPLLPEVDA